MDRISGKTLEVYVEFFSRSDAQAVVNKMIHQRDVQHRHIKLGDRHVEVLMSEQGALMEDLFPKAKNVKWNGQTPVIVPPTEPYNTGFKSFITGEELVQMVKHAQQPHRVRNPLFLLFFESNSNQLTLLVVWVQSEVSMPYLREYDQRFAQGRFFQPPSSELYKNKTFDLILYDSSSLLIPVCG